MNRPLSAMTLRNGGVVSLAELPPLGYADFAAALLAEVAAEGRIAAYFAAPLTGEAELDLFAIVAHDWRGELALLRTRLAGETFPSLTPRCPQLHLFEREVAEQYGIAAEGHPWFKPVRFHGAWRSGRDAWGRDPDSHPVSGDMEFYRVEGEEVHEVAVGPVHAGVIEPGHFRFMCHGETVHHLEIQLGYQHRGVEKLLLQRPPRTLTPIVESICGSYNFV